MGSDNPYVEGYNLDEEPDHEEWEDEDNPDPYSVGATDEVEQADDLGDLEQCDEGGDPDPSQVADDADPLLRPWADARAGAVAKNRAGPRASLVDALERIRASEVEFLYDCDELRQAAYVLARGPDGGWVGPRLAESIEVALNAAGIRVIRHGVRPGVARDGRRYHYFFRVERNDGTLPRRRAVRSSLRPDSLHAVGKSASRTDGQARSGLVLAGALEVAHADLRQALTRVGEAERRALGARHIADRRIVAYRRRLADIQAVLHGILRDIATHSGSSATVVALKASLRDLEVQLLQTSNDVDSALEFAAEQESRANTLEDELSWYRDEYKKILERVDSLEERGDGATAEELTGNGDEFITRLLPEVCFLNDSVPVLWNEADRLGWIRDLTLLVHDHPRFVEEIRQRGFIERTGGKPEWIEIRRTRSKRDMYRLYYTNELTPDRRRRYKCVSEHRWLVLLRKKTDKKQQSRDIESLLH